MLSKETLNEPEITYPLRMMWCQECSLGQLDYCVDGSVVYHTDYPYRSGITKELVVYQKSISHSLISKYNLQDSDLIVDLGSNDGFSSNFMTFSFYVIIFPNLLVGLIVVNVAITLFFFDIYSNLKSNDLSTLVFSNHTY